MEYPSYLIHYNKNHSKANGQFVSGDGDGDGVTNDHAHRSNSASKSEALAKAEKKIKVGKGLSLGSWGLTAASIGLASVGTKQTNVASLIAAAADISMFAVGLTLQDKGRREVAKIMNESGVKLIDS